MSDQVIQTDVPVRALTFSSQGDTLSGVGPDGKVRVWNVSSGKLIRTVPIEGRMFAFTTGADRIASFGDKGLRLSDATTAQVTREFDIVGMRQVSLIFSREASVLATSSRDKKVRIWDTATGKERVAVNGGLGGAMGTAFSPDGAIFVAADSDTNVRVWSTRNGELVRIIEELPVAMFALAFSPDGKYLVSAGVDRTVYLWDAKTWKLVRKIPGQAEMISCLAISPDSRLIVTGGFNDISSKMAVSILIRDLASGNVVRTMASPNRVNSTVFSPDGKLVATTNLDSGISLWRVP
ncbi:MAG TPA: WD40 repeat domain-containing protein [Bryobacteraceae bacterium]|nr:WD40 repeat domain-containing protein [Bryobacteraceae bacterium]